MTLDLYHLQGCPYCRKVREYIEANGLKPEIRYHEVSQEPGASARVQELTGDTKVPVLVVGDKPIAGSNVIVEWLATQAVAQQPGRRRDADAPRDR
jgi:glutaredoxin